MTDDQTYNGWAGNGTRSTAYATWRIMLELVDDYVNCNREEYESTWDSKPDAYDLAESIEENTREFVRGDDYDEKAVSTQYAMAFLDNVNWMEIAEHILSDWED